jgi:uncharacterized protein (UPF0332 family)
VTPEQSRLLEKARQSVAAADLLIQQGYHGFAASRAYYAMFYVAEAMLLADGSSFSKHAAVIATFGQRFARDDPRAAELHRYLIEGQESRTKGDYRSDDLVSEDEAETQILRARKFIEFATRGPDR